MKFLVFGAPKLPSGDLNLLTCILPFSVSCKKAQVGYSLIWAISVCSAPKGRVFQPFWS